MASLRIYQDQENLQPELRQKQTTTAAAMAAQQKRSALGVIDNNKPTKEAAKGKQVTGAPVPPLSQIIGAIPNRQPLKSQGSSAAAASSRTNNAQRPNSVAPVVPVAQFEAFKVYEDDEYMARIDKKLRQISKSNVYKGTAEDRFITKTELAERQRLMKENAPPQMQEPEEKCKEEFEEQEAESPATPMSIEKLVDENSLSQSMVLKLKAPRDTFFEMEEYREDIYAYLRELEVRHRPKAGYIVKQPDVTDSMRSILVDWLVEVVEEYKMHTETLYLAVNYIDRFLSYMSVVRGKLQLVGTAAMFIAAKYEEIFPPDVSEFVYITDDTYDKHHVIRMEHLILRVLGFDLSVPTPLTFINAMGVFAELSDKTLYLAMYLSELSMLEVEPYLQFLPSTIAASAIAVARHTLKDEAWNESLIEATGYSLSHLQNCVDFLYDMFIKAGSYPQHAIQDKYASPKYMQVSKIAPRQEMIAFD